MCTKTKEFTHERGCPHRLKKGPNPGYYFTEENGYTVIRECDCHIKWRLNNELERKLKLSGLRADYSFDNYRGTQSLDDLEALKEFTYHFDQYSYKKMIYLYGPNNTMKTSMATACGKELIKAGYTVQYCTMNELINNLVQSFNDANKEAKEAFIQRCLEVDLLILDECFDKSKVTIYSTGYQVPFLDNFLRSRFETGKKSLFFISNKLPTDIEAEGFGASLQSLIVRNTEASLLVFKDKWINNANQIDRLSLFKRGANNG